MARQCLDERIERGRQREGVAERMACRGVRQVGGLCGLGGGCEAEGALPRETIYCLCNRVLGRIARREREDRKASLDDTRGTMDDFRGRIRLGVKPAGFLEF